MEAPIVTSKSMTEPMGSEKEAELQPGVYLGCKQEGTAGLLTMAAAVWILWCGQFDQNWTTFAHEKNSNVQQAFLEPWLALDRG